MRNFAFFDKAYDLITGQPPLEQFFYTRFEPTYKTYAEEQSDERKVDEIRNMLPSIIWKLEPTVNKRVTLEPFRPYFSKEWRRCAQFNIFIDRLIKLLMYRISYKEFSSEVRESEFKSGLTKCGYYQYNKEYENMLQKEKDKYDIKDLDPNTCKKRYVQCMDGYGRYYMCKSKLCKDDPIADFTAEDDYNMDLCMPSIAYFSTWLWYDQVRKMRVDYLKIMKAKEKNQSQ